MLLDDPPTSAALTLQLAQLVFKLYPGNPGPAETQLVENIVGNAPWRGTSYPRNDLMPARAAYISGNVQFMVLEGIGTNAQASILTRGYSEEPLLANPIAANPVFYSAAIQALGELALQRTAQNEILLCGHSYGGAIAQVMAAELIRTGYPRNIRVISMGSPAPGTLAFPRWLSGVQCARWFNQGDPLPYMPPSPAQA